MATDNIDRIGYEVKRKENCNADYWGIVVIWIKSNGIRNLIKSLVGDCSMKYKVDLRCFG